MIQIPGGRLRFTRRRITAAVMASAGTSALGVWPQMARAAGQSIRNASAPVLIRFVNHNPTASYPPLTNAADLVTYATYISPNVHAINSNGRYYFDHSEAGIELGASNVANIVARYNQRAGNTGIAMFDVETYSAINVPPAAGYDPVRDRDLASRYDPSATVELRQEAMWYNSKLMVRTAELLATRVLNYELGCFNMPSSINWSSAFKAGRPDAFGTKLAQDLQASTLRPVLVFTGPPCRLNINQRMSDLIASGAITQKQLIDWGAINVATARKALGSETKVIPCLWPRFYGVGGASLPKGSAALWPGFMTQYCNALLDAGAQGFSCWTPSADQKLPAADQAAMMASWKEVVAVCRQRNFAKLIGG